MASSENASRALDELIEHTTAIVDAHEADNTHLPVLNRSVRKVLPPTLKRLRKELRTTTNKVSKRPLTRGRRKIRKTRNLKRTHILGVLYHMGSSLYTIAGVTAFLLWVSLALFTAYKVIEQGWNAISSPAVTEEPGPPRGNNPSRPEEVP